MCNECRWEELIEEIEQLQDDKRFEFASTTLEGIYNWVEERGHCTDAQHRAISNIKNSR